MRCIVQIESKYKASWAAVPLFTLQLYLILHKIGVCGSLHSLKFTEKMFFEIFLTFAVFLITYFIYKWFICQNDYFSLTQFKYIKPSRIFGNSFELKSTGYEAVKLLGSACPNEK